MATVKVWAEACLLAAPADVDGVAFVNMVLADVAETEAIISAYEEAVQSSRIRGARRGKLVPRLLEKRRRARTAGGMPSHRRRGRARPPSGSSRSEKPSSRRNGPLSERQGMGHKPWQRWRAQARASRPGGGCWRKVNKRQSKSSSCSRTREACRRLRLDLHCKRKKEQGIRRKRGRGKERKRKSALCACACC